MKKNTCEAIEIEIGQGNNAGITDKVNTLLEKYNTKGYRIVSTEVIQRETRLVKILVFFELIV